MVIKPEAMQPNPRDVQLIGQIWKYR